MGAGGFRAKKRIDQLLVERNLASTREKAQALLMAGEVLVEDRPITKPGTVVPESSTIRLKERLPYVSRGGIKLAHALTEFHINTDGLVALDVGASTGGFTDCLLQRGAKRIYALDVGYGQMDLKLRNDPRVEVMERTNARYPFILPEPVGLVTVDVAFISLTLVLPSLIQHLDQEGQIVALVKPQFEAYRGEVGSRGVIRSPRIHARVLGHIGLWVIRQGLRIRALEPAPIKGDAGNREFFLHLTLNQR
jgi:23S rRNA (cytidine1920-2'-O)/16S rRNA (cytidine1409-2'-O)-methyltransferase